MSAMPVRFNGLIPAIIPDPQIMVMKLSVIE
jgi:hypothetical protein